MEKATWPPGNTFFNPTTPCLKLLLPTSAFWPARCTPLCCWVVSAPIKLLLLKRTGGVLICNETFSARVAVTPLNTTLSSLAGRYKFSTISARFWPLVPKSFTSLLLLVCQNVAASAGLCMAWAKRTIPVPVGFRLAPGNRVTLPCNSKTALGPAKSITAPG